MHCHALLGWATVTLACAVTLVRGVRPGDFKACSDASVCRRFRATAERVEAYDPFVSPYSVGEPSIDSGRLTVPVETALHDVSFDMHVSFFADGNARVQMDERAPTYKGWQHYPEASMWGVVEMPPLATNAKMERRGGSTVVTWGDSTHAMHMEHSPLRIAFVRDGVTQMILNERALLHMEHFRSKPATVPEGDEQLAAHKKARVDELRARHPQVSASVIDMWAAFELPDKGEWEESWNGIKDSKPKGPEGVSLDISFPGYDTLYGLPEHASPLSLRSTRAPPAGEEEEAGRFTDPYRLMNTDVFEYEHDSPMALYGSSPIVHALSRASAVSVLWMNAAETWVDIHKTQRRPGKSSASAAVKSALAASQDDARARAGGSSSQSSHVYFMSESGILDLFVFMGPTLERNMERFMSLVGRTALPQYFAIGYHQCRWNYWSDDDVKDVSANFDRADMPMDVVWLDIEYSAEHMYGVWDKKAFKDPAGMMEALDARGRKLVIIMDPHLKTTDRYYLYKEAKSQGLFVKNADNKSDYEGECWSGKASWIDFFQPRTWQWWIDQFRLTKRKLEGNARNLFMWNDMSEPAIFSGPEVSSPKDVRHYPGWENRDIHNINGMIMQNLTATGLARRELGTHDKEGKAGVERRPFVLSRAWWLGSQRFGAIWTGDNMGTWEHFANSVPMILQNGMGGMSFCGADIGGFFGNPNTELLVRWYQAGIFEPFFRAHAHIDTKRREPFLYDGEVGEALRGLLQLRYTLLPVWYTAFWDSSVNGQPVLRPQALVFPDDTTGFTVDDQYYIGDSGLLIKPLTKEGASSVDVYLSDGEPYFHYSSGRVYRAPGRRVQVLAPLTADVPLLVRGGSIVPVRERARRAAELQRRDPFTLYVAPSSAQTAAGHLYMDDGQTYAYKDGAFIARKFDMRTEGNVVSLTASALVGTDVGTTGNALQTRGNAFEDEMQGVRVERIVIYGLPEIKSVHVREAGQAVPAMFVYTRAERLSPSDADSSGEQASRLVIRDPRVSIANDWHVEIQLA